MNGIRAVAFDIDGTLYPDWRLYIRIIPHFFKNIRFFWYFRKVRNVLHKTAPLADFYEYQARLLADFMHIGVRDAHALINKVVYDGLIPYFSRIKSYRHVLETFHCFHDAGLKLAILSDFPPSQKGDIWGCFELCDVVMGSEESGALKPSKYAFGQMALKLDVPPESILYVGNSIRCDIRGAQKAGMKTAYRMPLWRKIFNKPLLFADISFRNYRQLQDFVLE